MKPDTGQATVEFMLALPVLLLGLFGLLYVALVIRADLLVQEAAREAVRAASLDPDTNAASIAGNRVAPGATISVQRGGVGEQVLVSVSMPVSEHVPLISGLIPVPIVHANAVMRAER